MTSSSVFRQGALHAIFKLPILKEIPDFMLVMHCSYTSVVHCFRFDELFMFARFDVIAILLLFRDFIFMFNRYVVSILNGLDTIQLFFLWLGFPYWERKCRGLGAKWPLKHQLREKHVQGALTYTDLRVWAIVREIISIRLVCAGAQEKKVGKKEEMS